MDLPEHLNIFFYLDPMFINPKRPGPLPREDIDNFLVEVGNYILDLKQDDFDFQVARRKADMERQKVQYQRSEQPTPKKKVKKIRKLVRKVVK